MPLFSSKLDHWHAIGVGALGDGRDLQSKSTSDVRSMTQSCNKLTRDAHGPLTFSIDTNGAGRGRPQRIGGKLYSLDQTFDIVARDADGGTVAQGKILVSVLQSSLPTEMTLLASTQQALSIEMSAEYSTTINDQDLVQAIGAFSSCTFGTAFAQKTCCGALSRSRKSQGLTVCSKYSTASTRLSRQTPASEAGGAEIRKRVGGRSQLRSFAYYSSKAVVV
ncbi:hypothetical protein MRB53_036964 [Persea americana]|nr:hypothetical protein MRB53_036964 [Persea americana]